MKYVHHIPGRLRVRTERLRNNEQAAAQLRSRLARLSGVQCAEVNLLTGSALIYYDANAARLSDVLSVLRDLGPLDESVLSTGMSRPIDPELPRTIGKTVVKTVGSYLLQAAVERSVVALVAALV